MDGSRRPTRRARTILLLLVGGWLGIQVLVNLVLEARCPAIHDSEYLARVTVLRRRASESPDRPLLLVLGSSRISSDFRPETLPPLATANGEAALPFNFSHTGGGPLVNLTMIHRLIQDGFTPRWVVVELLPSSLGGSGLGAVAQQARLRDLPLLRSYFNPWRLCGLFMGQRLGSCFTCRETLSSPGILWGSAPERVKELELLEPLGGCTRLVQLPLAPGEVNRRTAAVRKQYYPTLQSLASIREHADRALRDLLERCGQSRIKVVLLLAPESSEFRSWYPPALRELVMQYCATLNREYEATVVDARDWLEDGAFCDGHHLLPDPAQAFTLRLGREVLQPLVVGRLNERPGQKRSGNS
jgi:hypothetical protein